MDAIRTKHILDTALWRFAEQGLHTTTTAEIARLSGVSVGTLFRTFLHKDDLLLGVYEHAVAQLQAPLLTSASQPQRSELLKKVLQRWWHLTADVALAQPHVVTFWRLYRTYPRPAGHPASLVGPFEPVLDLITRSLARKTWPTKNAPPVPVMVASLAGQWLAAVELVLMEAACQQEPALQQRVLERAYAGWWQGLGVNEFTSAADPVR
jgi:AcrR family transcriptional regulator